MRILYYYSSNQVDTGSPRALTGLIGTLDRARYEPLFLSSDPGGALTLDLARRGVEIVDGIVTEVSWRRPFRAAAAIRRAAATAPPRW